MPEQEYPRTPEESVGHLQKFKERGEQERLAPAEEAEGETRSEQEIRESEEKEIEKIKKEIGEDVESGKLEQDIVIGQELDPEQRLRQGEEKEFRKQISQDRFGDFGKFVKGAASAPVVFLGGLIYGAYKSVKILFWDHWLKKYFGGLIDTLKGPGKKQ